MMGGGASPKDLLLRRQEQGKALRGERKETRAAERGCTLTHTLTFVRGRCSYTVVPVTK